MSIFGFFGRRGSAPVARERLQILLAYERGSRGQSDLLAILREEILAVIERHVCYVSSSPRFPSPVVEGADEFVGLSFHVSTRVGGRGVGGLTPAHRARAHLLFHLRREFPFVREF